MDAAQRFLQYVTIHTMSQEGTGSTPSTARQLDLARLLTKQLQELGIEAYTDAYGYVYGAIPATAGCENAPVLGLVAHMDTAPAFSGENVRPLVHKNYDGGDLALPKNGCVLRPSEFPALLAMQGKTVITADGSTLLGADDKAGIAEIISACEVILQENRPHGAVKIAFTPDEEIGQGTEHFNIADFGADYAYTLDGDAVGGIEYENFNAATAVFTVEGVSVHPGAAKNTMENALIIACELNAALPMGQTPRDTESYEGFYHLEALEGDTAKAKMVYIVRDHSEDLFAARKAKLEAAARMVQSAHLKAKIGLEITDSYHNMARQIEHCMHLVENARKAAEMAGVAPSTKPIRGGTDGARLSFMGLPCPNLGTGGCNFHGPYECIAAEDMDKAVEIICNLIGLYGAVRKDSL